MQKNMNQAMHQEQMRRKRRKITSILLAWALALLVIVGAVFCVVTLVMAAGGKSLREKGTGNRPNLMVEETGNTQTDENNTVNTGNNPNTVPSPTPAPTEAPVIWQEGWVRYGEKVYEYNEDILTFLVLGIDSMNPVKESKSVTGGGQSDANFLVIINPDEKDINILAINRDTMTEIQMYGAGENGSTPIAYAQIATQHGFGGGKELSCELTRDTISALLYDLPIHGYMAMNMGAIPKLNDALGGVEVTVLEDLTKISKNSNLKEGAIVTLQGMDAFWYVKYRDTGKFESNRDRLVRQKQYLTAFAQKVTAAVKQDLTLPVTLYQELSQYMVTDMTVQEVAYLAKELAGYHMAEDAIHTLEGTTQQSGKFEEFYPDKEALKAQIIALFYQEVDLSGNGQ